ncbi:MAG: glycosyltransferase [Methyloprofundus sp.]|nr:glycosyltransferase [Methyloprofundus sp.]
MTNKKKLLFISNSYPNNINNILDAFKNRNDLILNIEHLWLKKQKNIFFDKVFNKLKIPLDIDNINKRIIESIIINKPDILFIIKGNNIYPWTIKKIKQEYPNIVLISWSLDDMFSWHNRSFYYTLGIKYYDFVFTTKSYNIDELKVLGAQRVKFLNQAFSNKYHKPCHNFTKAKYKADVIFIGFAEQARFEYLIYLAQNGIKIDIYGSGWDKKKFRYHHKNINLNTFDLLGENYANALSCSKISLCFLRKANRDLHTSRSIEIPACAGFMLAERTDEHKALFAEDKEAVFFSTQEELLNQVNYYLEHDNERKKIAQAGYARTKRDDYSYDNMVKKIFGLINES